jgi:hypothetical protein
MTEQRPTMAQPEATSAWNLLVVFKKRWEKPASPKELLAEYVSLSQAQDRSDMLFRRNLTLIMVSGVLFSIHSVMLVGGPKVLEDYIFPGGATQEHPPAVVNLPSHHHPVLVDCLVTFLYTSDYQFDQTNAGDELKPSNFQFHNATHIPADDPPSPAVKALVGIGEHIFHLFMYALAEELDYGALKVSAYDALAALFVVRHQLSTPALKDAVEATFAPPGDAARICNDEDGVLQNLIAVSVIAHEANHWDYKHHQEFNNALQGPGYAPFWTAYNAIKEENDDIIKQGKSAKELCNK